MKYSVIVPAYNEEKNVARLYREIVKVMETLGGKYEIIFVNDGSKDNTFKELKKLPRIKVINFRRNFGQTAALDAGIHLAKGKILITLDADLQNDPHDIPKLLTKLEEGYDLVSGWRFKRQDSFGKRFFSKVADILRRRLVNDGIHDSGCTLKVYRAECFQNGNARLYGEMHRYIPAMLIWQGFKVGEVKVNHRPRKYGQSKYGWKRLLKGFVDLINVWFWRKYSDRPIHVFGVLGIFLIGSGTLGLIFLLLLRFLKNFTLANRVWPLLTVFMILTGVQLFVSGIMADIIMRTYFANVATPPYNIKEVIENP